MSFWSAIASGVSGIFGGIGSAISSNTQRKIAQEYNQAQRELAEYQNDWNMDMWNRQNEYNSPVQQMARYQQAGLNPHLIYGQGSNGNSQSVPKAASYDVMAVPRVDAGNMLQGFMNSAMQMAQLENIKANTDKVLSERTLTDVKAYNTELLSEFQEIVNEIKGKTKDREIQDILTRFDRSLVQYDIDVFNRDVLQPLAKLTGNWNINKIKSDIALNNQKAYESMANEDYINDKNKREGKIVSADLEVKNAYIRNLDANTRKANAEAYRMQLLTPFEKEIKKVESENARVVLQSSLDKIASEIYTNYMNGRLRESDYYIASYRRLLAMNGYNPDAGQIGQLAQDIAKQIRDMVDDTNYVGPDAVFEENNYHNKYTVK